MGIKKAKLEQLGEIAELKINTWKGSYKDIINEDYLNNIDFEAEKKSIISIFDNPNSHIIIYDFDGEIIGYCAYRIGSDDSAFDSEIISIYVKPKYQRNNIGTDMLRHAQNSLKDIGKKFLLTRCLSDCKVARNFYEKLGGKEYYVMNEEIGDNKYPIVTYEFLI